MRNLATLFAMLVLVTAQSASAQPASAQGPEQDAPDAAAAHALAEAAIARSGGDTVWENVTGSTRPELRHRQSGARCRFWAGSLYPWARTDPYGIAVPLGSEVSCSTWIRPGGDYWSFEVAIEAASQSLLGSRYEGFDGRFTPAFVTPEYRGWRSAHWASFRGGPVQHDPTITIAGPGGEPLKVQRLRFTMLDAVSVTRMLTVLVDGWIVHVQFSAPIDRERAAETMVLAHLEHIVGGMDRPHAEAAAVQARVEALRAAEAAPPPGPGRPIVSRIAETFELACAGRPRQGARSPRRSPPRPAGPPPSVPPGLPNIARNPSPRVWRVPGEGAALYVHLDAAMTGDCAVSAYGVDAAVARAALLHRLARAPGARFATGLRSLLDAGIEMQGLEGRGWPAEASLITNANDRGDRPSVFIGVRRPRPR